jgi:hypothetical protein
MLRGDSLSSSADCAEDDDTLGRRLVVARRGNESGDDCAVILV